MSGQDDMFLVAVTGGIASGKSTVCKLFQELGCQIIDADIIAREVVEPGKPAWKKIRQHFGSDVFHPDGSLNRDILGQLVFANDAKRKLLNSIIHPHIYRRILYLLLRQLWKGKQFVILDLPLLFETGTMLPFINSTIVVYCSRNEQIERLQARNAFTHEAAIQRINAQMPLDIKREKATYVVDNSGNGEKVRDQVLALYSKLKANRAHWKLRAIAAILVSFPVILIYYFL